ncbi:hypothetical protein C7974DRAFT_424586 [Boeremia exigua]|uniref:uncharacterized protein n=1 Tax=Boeremia exigua TaxID=749465 RepID=UPI001E8D4A05|nr:uncharacterized protein C7974DRAFT_424586 [Boeremia exigua]KAH6629564.1 hypothetical protein C7974DRAFT_424586 [Boeremia exigua]
MAVIAKNNAFGAGSPSWNLSFPDGNLTAAEILAYLPHWLKSVDVILRLVNHGGRSVTITHFLNTYRTMPTDDYQPNSTTVMMHYAMRRTGKSGWTISSRHKFDVDREYAEDSLYVGDFRPPRLTHPKIASYKQKAKKEDLARNSEADPIPFKDLAIHVKKHPSGYDALDLTRCVKYAVKNPTEEWFFPTDFKKLVKHIGGPRPVTHSHLDRQLFARYDYLYTAHDPSRLANKRKAADPTSDSEGDSDDGSEPSPKRIKYSRTRKSASNTTATAKKVARQTKGTAMTETTPRETSGRGLGQMDGSHDRLDGKRRSSRQVKKVPVYNEKDDDASDVDAGDADYATPRRVRKSARVLKEEESDFEAKDELESEDELVPQHNAVADRDFGTPTAARGRRVAGHKARQIINEQSSAALMEQFNTLAASAKPAHRTFDDPSPEMMAVARDYASRTPVHIPAPVLSGDRMVIDDFTVFLYAQEGCRNADELWASALSTYRFGGPRRHAPFRELYRLTEPYPWDTSDWAENIRWAKEQYKLFGSKTWTEYDDHLDTITDLRRSLMWVSEESLIMGLQGIL